MTITPQLTGMPRAGGEHRTVEDVALRQLPPEDQIRLDAVEHGLRMMRTYSSRDKRLAFVSMVYFRKTHTVYGAAIALEVSEMSVKQWNTLFLGAIYSYLEGKK